MGRSVVLLSLVFLFPLGEVALAVFRRAPLAQRRAGGGSPAVLWLLVLCGVVAGIAGTAVPAARIPGPRALLAAVAGSLLATGLLLRWLAVLTLGRLFTVDLAIRDGHVVVSTGVYRHLRHPSYAGLLLALVGLGVFFGNWLALAALTVPPFLALRARMRVEEQALRQALGPAYAAYCSRTRRLVPGIY
ncbi:MAG TPA: isoprenylcysteine carboxylmethyltransferase family protein [Vicinamibacteria bacterium]|nr:isoprenylcysteine carboxylmethyltransferase family protein [Vicinamibacteria bacterium]